MMAEFQLGKLFTNPNLTSQKSIIFEVLKSAEQQRATPDEGECNLNAKKCATNAMTMRSLQPALRRNNFDETRPRLKAQSP